jgi:hypothetical protein
MLLHVTILLRELVDEVSADSRFQLDLEIALNVVSAKIQPHELFSPGRRCVETSGDVIEGISTSTPDSRIWDFSPMRLGTVAMCVCNEDRSPLGIKG